MQDFKIKICGMREAENIKAVLALRPDFMGFIFYKKSSRLVEHIDEIAKIDFGQTQKVAVFVNEHLDTILRTVEMLKADFVQLHGSESSEYCKKLQKKGLKVIKAFAPRERFDFDSLEKYQSYVEYFLFDTPTEGFGGSGKQFDWTILKKYTSDKPFFLSGGIGIDNIEEVRQFRKEIPFFAVDINSKFEIKPALKDLALLKELYS